MRPLNKTASQILIKLIGNFIGQLIPFGDGQIVLRKLESLYFQKLPATKYVLEQFNSDSVLENKIIFIVMDEDLETAFPITHECGSVKKESLTENGNGEFVFNLDIQFDIGCFANYFLKKIKENSNLIFRV